MFSKILLVVLLLSGIVFVNQMTGYTVSSQSSPNGCCDSFCMMTDALSCDSSNFHQGESCKDIDSCNVGCCVVSEGYCFSNSLKGKCISQGGFFESRMECNDYIPCISPPEEDSFRGSMGYPVSFSSASSGYIFSEPSAISGPSDVKISFMSFEEDISPELLIEGDGFSSSSSLVFDGVMFSKVWNSGSFFGELNFSVILDGVVVAKKPYYVSNSDCLVIKRGKDNLIFLSNLNETHSSFRQFYFSQLGSFFSSKDVGFSFFEENVSNNAYLRCPAYSPDDYVIFFDSNQQICEVNGNVAKLNPEFVLDDSLARSFDSLDLFFENICDIVKSKAMLEAEFEEEFSSPYVELIFPQNRSNFDADEILVYFSVSDNRDGEFPYEIYVDSVLYDNGFLFNHEGVEKELILSDGYHEVWAEVTDNDGNVGQSDVSYITVNKSNFFIFVKPFENYYLNSSFEIEFNVSYENLVHCSLYDNGASFDIGSVSPNVPFSFVPNLAEGRHELQIMCDYGDEFSSSPLYKIRIVPS